MCGAFRGGATRGSICSGEDGGADAKDVAGDQGIWQRAREGCIAMHGGDADQVRVMIGDHEREDIVVPRVAVNNHRGALGRAGHARTLAHPSASLCPILHA